MHSAAARLADSEINTTAVHPITCDVTGAAIDVQPTNGWRVIFPCVSLDCQQTTVKAKWCRISQRLPPGPLGTNWGAWRTTNPNSETQGSLAVIIRRIQQIPDTQVNGRSPARSTWGSGSCCGNRMGPIYGPLGFLHAVSRTQATNAAAVAASPQELCDFRVVI